MYDDFDETDGFDDSFINCGECGQSFYEDSDKCPHCGWLVVADERPWAGKPSWFRRLGLVLIVMVIIALAWPAVEFIQQVLGRAR